MQKLRKQLVRKGGAGAAAAAVQQEPTGFAALKGTFLLAGDPPPPVPLNINAEPGICAPGGKTVYSQDLLVDKATGGIANVVIYARGVPADFAHESAKPGKTGEVEFDQKECMFTTHVLALQESQTIKILNSDRTGHNTNIQGTGFNSIIAELGFSLFNPAGEQSLPIKTTCNIHPWMVAYILPRKDSYFAVTKPDGSFEIANLPAGIDLTFQVWHERVGNLKAAEVDGQPQQWKKGQFKLTLNPNEPKVLAIRVPVSTFQ